MLRTVLCLSAVLATAACATQAPPSNQQWPVSGTVGKDLGVTGVAQANPYSPLGFYAVRSADNRLRCNGTFDASSTEPRLIVPVSCEDGRFGAMEVLRNPDLKSGAGRGALNDGTPVRVTYGDMPAK